MFMVAIPTGNVVARGRDVAQDCVSIEGIVIESVNGA
jgi:hypothetical protein